MDRFKTPSISLATGSAGTTSDTLYTVPVAAEKTAGSPQVSPKASSIHVQSVLTTIIVCNDSGADSTLYTITLTDASNSNLVTFLAFDTVLVKDKIEVLDLRLTLSAGDIIKVGCSGQICDITANVIETVTGSGPDA